MVKMQRQVLAQYSKIKGGLTLREIANDTGIGISRVFRIIHGSEMRLGEYQIFRDKIFAAQMEVGDFHDLLKTSFEHLNGGPLVDIQRYIKKKLNLNSLVRTQKRRRKKNERNISC